MPQHETPTVGRIVHYTASDGDAKEINRRREDAGAFRRTLTGPLEAGEIGRTGHVEHVGNHVSEGDVFPATIVRTFGATNANLQVHMDGSDTYWATSRPLGDGPGTWAWPLRTPAVQQEHAS